MFLILNIHVINYIFIKAISNYYQNLVLPIIIILTAKLCTTTWNYILVICLSKVRIL